MRFEETIAMWQEASSSLLRSCLRQQKESPGNRRKKGAATEEGHWGHGGGMYRAVPNLRVGRIQAAKTNPPRERQTSSSVAVEVEVG